MTPLRSDRIRVLVVDDSVVARRLVTEALHRHPRVDVVAAVSSGVEALRRLDAELPDLVTLDVEMPHASGLEVLREIKRLHPRLPVVMVSSLTARGAAVTVDALLLGADDYVTKPQGASSAAAALTSLADALLPKVEALYDAGHSARSGRPASTPSPRATTAAADAIVVGASTGGPDALAHLCAALPALPIAPIVVVQHMPAMFTEMLADRLNRACVVEVLEATDGLALVPGRVVVAAGGYHLRLDRVDGTVRTRLDDGPEVHSCRPAIDVTLADAAAVWGRGLLAVVLTGMGRDGADGAGAVRAAGGRVIVQDAATSVVWGMPGAVVAAGHADATLPLDLLCRRVSAAAKPRVIGATA